MAAVDACLIVRDEEDNLGECVSALKNLGIISTVWVYDTGSLDGTVDLARHLGCRVEQGYWDDDFARARNAAMAMTRAEWVLVVDADERVSGVGLEAVLSDAQGDVDAFVVEQVNLGPDGAEASVVPLVRLMRRDAVTWRSRVHEQVVTRDGSELVVRALPRSVLSLLHHGYADADERRRKAERNATAALTGVARAREEGDIEALATALLHLGRSLWVAEREAAEPHLAEAYRTTQRSGLVLHSGMRHLVTLYLARGHVDQAVDLIGDCRSRGGDEGACAVQLARVLEYLGRVSEATEQLRGVRPSRWAPAAENEGALIELLLRAGRRDEALAEALRFLVQDGRDGDVVSPSAVGWIVRLAGDGQDLGLITLLAEVAGDHRPEVVAALERHGGVGIDFAQKLKALGSS